LRRRGLLRLAAVALIVYGLGFLVFAAKVPEPLNFPPAAAADADAIVALTGDGDRLGPAVSLLEQGSAMRLLITGVNKMTTKHDLKVLLHGGDHFECCADLGFAAADTRGNADEAARWAEMHGYRSLVVITAAYHMPRSLIEFGAAMPGVKLVPYPVAPETSRFAGWQNLRRMQGEYAKYLASIVRVSMTKAMPPA
jgi:uncharacterized SAM-binding protein YcdF (DUF218 family)